MPVVGERERDQAARRLRFHYAEGRLDERELEDRLDLVLRARSRWEIAYALRRLPLLGEVAVRARHGLVLAVVGAVWLMLTGAIVVAFVAWVAVNGASLAALVAFPAVWVALSALAYRRAAVSRRRLPRL